MEIQPLKIGTKMAKVPVIQGGMGVGISLGNLAGAVAKEGGIGIISAAQPGFKDIFVKSLARKSETIKRIHSMAIKFDLFENLVKDGIVASKLHVK